MRKVHSRWILTVAQFQWEVRAKPRIGSTHMGVSSVEACARDQIRLLLTRIRIQVISALVLSVSVPTSQGPYASAGTEMPSVIVVKTSNIIFSKICAALHCDQVKWDEPGIF